MSNCVFSGTIKIILFAMLKVLKYIFTFPAIHLKNVGLCTRQRQFSVETTQSSCSTNFNHRQLCILNEHPQKLILKVFGNYIFSDSFGDIGDNNVETILLSDFMYRNIQNLVFKIRYLKHIISQLFHIPFGLGKNWNVLFVSNRII